MDMLSPKTNDSELPTFNNNIYFEPPSNTVSCAWKSLVHVVDKTLCRESKLHFKKKTITTDWAIWPIRAE